MNNVKRALATICLVITPLATSAQTFSTATLKVDAKQVAGLIINQGQVENDGKISEVTETTQITNLTEFYAERGVTYFGSPSAGNVTEGGGGGIPPTIPPPFAGSVPDWVTYSNMSAVGGGYIRWTSYTRTSTSNGGGSYSATPWSLHNDGLLQAPSTCRPGNLDNCPTLPK